MKLQPVRTKSQAGFFRYAHPLPAEEIQARYASKDK
jgi:hypothetical protein